jgi:Terminase large subunit, T4likevirus-type, N-terminal
VLVKIKLEASKMSDIPLNIIEFLEHPDLLNDRSLSPMQRVILKAIYGLPLDESELDIYYAATKLERYEATEQREATVIAGRRSGKTSKIAAPIVIYEAFRDHGLPQGEVAFVLLTAPQLYQAKIAFRSIRRYLHQSRILSRRIIRETQDEIWLDNGVVIACYPASFIAVRGVSIIAVICDEMAFWPHESSAANPEQEILDALQPGMANVARSKLIKISTPFGKQGVLYTEFQRRAELDFPVFQVPTSLMNPAIRASELERYRKKGLQKYQREFNAEFSENLTAWIDRDMLDRCVVRGRKELPPHSKCLLRSRD